MRKTKVLDKPHIRLRNGVWVPIFPTYTYSGDPYFAALKYCRSRNIREGRK